MDLMTTKARTSHLEASISELKSKILSFYEEAMLESMTTKSDLILKRENLLEKLKKAKKYRFVAGDKSSGKRLCREYEGQYSWRRCKGRRVVARSSAHRRDTFCPGIY